MSVQPLLFEVEMMNRWLKMLAAMSTATFLAACGSDDDESHAPVAAPVSIAETAQGAGLNALVAAATKAGLVPVLSDPSQNLTVFAPSDAAFTSMATALGFADAGAMVDALSAERSGKDPSVPRAGGPQDGRRSGRRGAVQPTLYSFDGSATTLALNTASGVKLTDAVLTEATVTTADVVATNGVVHVIDKVLVPPGVLNVVQMAQLNPAFSTLVGAVVRRQPRGDALRPGPFTVFAPTDAAFAAIASTVASLSPANSRPCSPITCSPTRCCPPRFPSALPRRQSLDRASRSTPARRRRSATRRRRRRTSWRRTSAAAMA